MMTDKNDKDKALWAHVTKDVKPLEDRFQNKQNENVRPELKNRENRDNETPSNRATQKPKSNEIDYRTAQRLKKGQVPIDGRLDLHGMTQNQAFDALQSLIPRAYTAEKRCLLIITGKGTRRSASADEKPGVLKQKVPHWLSETPLNHYVLKIQTAHVKDGGEGALYVYLRRNRAP